MEAQINEISQSSTKKLQESVLYKNYISWLKSQNIRVDQRVNFPTVFQRGLVGVSAKQKIQPKTAIVAVPFSIVIDSEKIKQMQRYRSLINQNPVLFKSTEGEVYLLCAYLIIQKLKGQKSFYYPYFQVLPSGQLSKWNKKQVSEIEHPSLVCDMINYKQQIQEGFVSLLRVIRTNSDLFPEAINNSEYRQHFEWAYQIIRTRAFSTTPSSISLVPFADAFNHGQPSICHSLIDLNWWRVPCQFSYKRRKINLSIFNDELLKPTLEEMKSFKELQMSQREKYIQKHEQILQGNKHKLSEEKAIQRITYLQYNTGNHTLRQLQMFEDDDSDDDESGSEINYNQYRKLIKKQKQSLRGAKIDPKQLIKDYWELYQEKTKKRIMRKAVQDKEQSDTSLSEDSKDSFEESEQQSSDEELQWMNDSKQQDVYFIIYTQSTYSKGQQIYNSYGKRSNNFLLLHYNFSIIDNPYDYYMFRMKIDGNKKKPQELVIYEIPKKDKKAIITKQIKIKMNSICLQLINHCRYILSPNTPKSIIIPNGKELQLKVLELSKSIIKNILKRYETTLDEDEELLQNKALNTRLFSAIILRTSHKKILSSQIKLIEKAIQFLSRVKGGRIGVKQGQMQYLCHLRPYLQNVQRGKL